MKYVRFLVYIVFIFGLIAVFSDLLQTEEGSPLTELEFVTYDNVLYSPEKLRHLTAEEAAAGHVGWDYDYNDKEFSRVRTNQMILHLTPGETYGLYTERLTYASNLYIDGKLMASLGTVSDSPEGFVPKTGSVLVYFTAGEETEIVVQRSNFNHAKWNIFRLYLGPQDVITRQVQNHYFGEAAYLGLLLALGILNLGMFFGMTDRLQFLWFSLSCFVTMVHQSLQDPKLIMLLFPNLNWYVGYKMEGISLLLLILFILLFIRSCYGIIGWKWADYGILAILGSLILVFLVSPTLIYTRYTTQLEIAVVVCGTIYALIILVKVIRKWKQVQSAQRYYLAGMALFLATGVMSVLRIGPSHMNLIRVGIVLFELAITLALSMEFRDVQDAFKKSLEKEKQLLEMNEAMEQAQQMHHNFMAILNHEMRTPLTVIAGYADLSSKQLELKDSSDSEIIKNLQLVKKEALRLGRIVEQSEEGATSALNIMKPDKIKVRSLLEDAAGFCKPICEKRQNKIVIVCRDDLFVTCIRDTILQALYNLIINGSRHTEKGTITLRGEAVDRAVLNREVVDGKVADGDNAGREAVIVDDAGRKAADREAAFGAVLISVADDGDGMDDDTIRKAFDRGYSKDGGHGLGLALCKEIAEHHNGRIWIEKNTGKGITVKMIIPENQDHPEEKGRQAGR